MNILIATHGKFAEGIYSAAKLILGEVSDVDIINAYLDDISLEKKLNDYFEAHTGKILVLTDLFGGSVNQLFMSKLQCHDIELITGINLALVLEILTKKDQLNNTEEIREIVKQSSKQLIYVNDTLANMSELDDFE